MKKLAITSILSILLAAFSIDAAAKTGSHLPEADEVGHVVKAATRWFAATSQAEGKIERVEIARVLGATLLGWRKSESAEPAYISDKEYWMVSFKVATENKYGSPVALIVRCVVDPTTLTVVE